MNGFSQYVASWFRGELEVTRVRIFRRLSQGHGRTHLPHDISVQHLSSLMSSPPQTLEDQRFDPDRLMVVFFNVQIQDKNSDTVNFSGSCSAFIN
jgi:hypothetical protein